MEVAITLFTFLTVLSAAVLVGEGIVEKEPNLSWPTWGAAFATSAVVLVILLSAWVAD